MRPCFTDRTIEATAQGEEAVVSKDARVVEEVGIRKDATQRTETVTDKVRRTEVEVEDERGNISRTGTTVTGDPQAGLSPTMPVIARCRARYGTGRRPHGRSLILNPNT